MSGDQCRLSMRIAADRLGKKRGEARIRRSMDMTRVFFPARRYQCRLRFVDEIVLPSETRSFKESHSLENWNTNISTTISRNPSHNKDACPWGHFDTDIKERSAVIRHSVCRSRAV